MEIQQDLIFWKIVKKLVIKNGFRLANMSGDQREIWLEPFRSKHYHLVRFVRQDIDWGIWISQDIERAANMFETIRRQSAANHLNVLNVYITALPPVDDWEFRIETPYMNGKTTIHTVLMDQHHIDEKINFLEEALSVVLDDVGHERDDLAFDTVDHIKTELFSFIQKQEKQERALFENGKPFFTYIFLFAQIVMFLILEWSGGSTNSETLIKFGAKYNPAIYDGEWWRFFTPIFLHIGMLHLLMNSFALYFIGIAVEKMYGSLRFLLIYLFAGFTGSLASFAFSPFLSAGASGAIFGLFGALLFFGVIKPKLFFRTIGPNILVVVAINLMLGWTIPNVDNAGHIGGLIGGFLAAFALQLPKMSRFLTRTVGILLAIGFVLGLWFYGYEIAPKRNSEMALAFAQSLISNQDFQKASDILSEARTLKDASIEMTYLLAYSEYRLGNVNEAIEYLKEVIEKDSAFHQAYYVLSLIYAEQNEFAKAKEAIELALKIDPDRKEYQLVKEQLSRF